ncbi:Hypothetical protein, putative [Bodo saltans]|uniref:Uncharacterized protein n=1 Tax=Bodo saltans TaxID=75058 RepID=A0A0S4IW91_BODSA|nr:Hypothetical protein, putative [Bodo saltans]|eukprot:CUG26681.1 Hypothetical protein, putative [Bodo saltans]
MLHLVFSSLLKVLSIWSLVHMRRFQKQSRTIRCAIRIDVEHNMEEGALASSSPAQPLTTSAGDQQQESIRAAKDLYLPFREAVKSAHALSMMRETLAVLFGASAPLITTVAADADQQLLHIEVSGGQHGAEQLRAACAIIQTFNAADGNGRIPVRCTLQKVTVQ